MTFRRLNTDELAALEQPFIKFLVANTITGADWEKMKTQEPARAEKMLDIFSDFTFEERLKKVEYIQHQEPREWRLFKCAADRMFLIGLQVDVNSDIDFTTETDFSRMGADTEGSHIYRAEKAYTRGREREIFELLEDGCRIADGKMFDVLAASF